MSFMLNRSGHAQIPGLLTKFSNLQKTAVRIISGSAYNAHTEPLFKSLEILPLPDLILFSKLQFMQKITQHFLPISFSETWVRNNVSVILVKMRSSSATIISCNFFILTLQSWICSLYLIILKFGNPFLTSKSKLFANQMFLTRNLKKFF